MLCFHSPFAEYRIHPKHIHNVEISANLKLTTQGKICLANLLLLFIFFPKIFQISITFVILLIVSFDVLQTDDGHKLTCVHYNTNLHVLERHVICIKIKMHLTFFSPFLRVRISVTNYSTWLNSEPRSYELFTVLAFQRTAGKFACKNLMIRYSIFCNTYLLHSLALLFFPMVHLKV